jgi:hypothetical protein
MAVLTENSVAGSDICVGKVEGPACEAYTGFDPVELEAVSKGQ